MSRKICNFRNLLFENWLLYTGRNFLTCKEISFEISQEAGKERKL